MFAVRRTATACLRRHTGKNNSSQCLKKKHTAEFPTETSSFRISDPPPSSDAIDWSEDITSNPAYPSANDPFRDQASLSNRPNVDPKSTSIVLFPGEGSQFVGMGERLLDYPLVKEMYEIASTILDVDIKRLSLDGPKEELDKTIHSQPAILLASLAAVQKLKHDNPEAIEQCIAAAGFGVGEIAALVFAGAIPTEAAIRIVKVRAEAMQAASELIPGGMMTVFTGHDARIKYACSMAQDWCKHQGLSDPYCLVANFIGPDCKVIAGNEETLRFIQDNADKFGILRYKRLLVSGAFHTNLMRPAEPGLRAILEKTNIDRPSISVHSNIDGKIYGGPYSVRWRLAAQISKPVKWEQTMHILYERSKDSGHPRTYVCGPGRSLRTILGMNNKKTLDNAECVEA